VDVVVVVVVVDVDVVDVVEVDVHERGVFGGVSCRNNKVFFTKHSLTWTLCAKDCDLLLYVFLHGSMQCRC